MELAGPLPEQSCRFEISADQYRHRLRHFLLVESNRRPFSWHGGLWLIGRSSDAFEIAAERVDGEFPSILGFRQKSRQDRDSEFFAIRAHIFQRARYRRDGGEFPLSQKAAQFEIRIGARFHATQDFEEIFVADDKRGVALLNFVNGIVGNGLTGASGSPGGSRHGFQLTFTIAVGATPANRRNQTAAEAIALDGIVKESLDVLTFEPQTADNRLQIGRAHV